MKYKVSVATGSRFNYYILVIIFAAFSVAFLIANMSINEKLSLANCENDLLKAENNSLTVNLKKACALNEDLKRSFPGLSKAETDEYKKRGLSNPENDIINDLGSREELMPFKGVFGARPSFYREVRMYVLNAKWAFASFDDGSNIGQTLIDYSVSDSGVISWKVIETYMSKVSKAGVPSE